MPRKVLIITSFGIVGLLSVYLLIFIFVNTNKSTFNASSKNANNLTQQQTAFTSSAPAPKNTTLDINFDKYGGDLKNQTDGKTIFGLGTSILDFNFNADWNYANTPYWAKVKAIGTVNNTIVLNFLFPTSMPYIGKDMQVEVVGCNKNNSFLRDVPKQINAVSINFMTELKTDDEMIGYCLNKDCTQVGKLCKIYRN